MASIENVSVSLQYFVNWRDMTHGQENADTCCTSETSHSHPADIRHFEDA
jgi:hypothetical protein